MHYTPWSSRVFSWQNVEQVLRREVSGAEDATWPRAAPIFYNALLLDVSDGYEETKA